jgi:DNA-binding GntR family transcriptional regulator
VREALAELARVGLVEQVPRRGARVAYPTLAQIHCEFEIRTALLALAARLACQRAGEGERAAIVAEIDAVHCVIGEGAAPLEIVAQGVRLSRRINAASGSRDVSDMLEAAHQRAEWHYSHIGDRLGAFVDRVDACWIDARDGFLRHDADRVETAVRTSMRIVQRETVAHLVSIGFGAPG